jgi:hypothetical protein
LKLAGQERDLKQLPPLLIFAFILTFILQVAHQQYSTSSLNASFTQLARPFSAGFYRSVAMGSDKLWSYLLLLKVQLHDNQRGRHENYKNLDYKTLSDWLLTLSRLNPDYDYPAFLAARVYSQVGDRDKIRDMISVIEQLFEQNPALHWRRMTEACLLAKHQLNDLDLALALAKKVASLPKSIELPYWARDMRLILLDDLNQLQSAQILISSMLQSGSITDTDELRFLKQRLLKIQQQMSEGRQSRQVRE